MIVVGDGTLGRGGIIPDSLRGARDGLISKLDAAGNIQWTHLFGGSRQDAALSVWPTQDGGYLVGGYSTSPRGGDKSENPLGGLDYWIVKLSTTGQKQWDRTLGTNIDDQIGQAWQTSDGNYVVIGITDDGPSNGNKTQASHGGRDAWAIKLSATGQVLWDRTLGGSGDDYLQAGTPTADGGSILVGSTASPADGDVSQPTPVPTGNGDDGWVVKIDANGTIQWDRRLGGGDGDGFGSVRQTLDGGYVLGGGSASGISGDHSEASRGGVDCWVVKLNAAGSKQWDHRFGTVQDDYLFDITEVPGTGYLLCVQTTGGIDGDKSQPNKGEVDVWIVRINATGAAQWNQSYGGTGVDVSGTVTSFPNGDFAFAARSYSGISGDKTRAIDISDGWVVRCNSLGVKIGEQILGGGIDDVQQVIVQTTDKGYFLGGQTEALEGLDISGSQVIGTFGSSWWLLKRDSLGVARWDTLINNLRIIRLRNIQPTANGGVLVGGSTTDTNSLGVPAGPLDADFLALRLDSRNRPVAGLLTFGGTGDDWLGEARTTSDNAVALAGTSRSGVGRDKSEASRGGADFWLLKLNMGYTKQWDHRYGGSGLDSLVSMRQTTEGTFGGYIMAGSTTSPISGNITEASRGGADFWLVKTNNLGVLQWQHRYGGPGDDWLASARPTPDGGYLLLGTTTGGIGGEMTEASRGRRDLWAVKVDNLGVVQWQHRYGGSGNEYAVTVEVDPDGGYIVGASTTSPVSGEVSEPSRGGTDYWLLRLSAQGTVLWDSRRGGSGEDVLTCLTTTKGYGYALGGQSNSPTGSGEHQQASTRAATTTGPWY